MIKRAREKNTENIEENKNTFRHFEIHILSKNPYLLDIMKKRLGKTMNVKEMLEAMREEFQKRFPITEDEMKFITLRNDKKGKLRALFTKDYWKRNVLVSEGRMAYGYAFKSYQFNMKDPTNAFPIWILISPSSYFDEHPEEYAKIAENLWEFQTKKSKQRKEKELQRILLGELSEPQYFELPKELTNQQFVYLCSCYVYESHISSFHLGFLPILYAPTKSKEILLLPMKYWNEEFLSFYKEMKNL